MPNRIRYFCLALLLSNTAFASDLNVQKQVHHIPVLTLTNGQVLKEVRLGFETYGELNAEKSNAVLITHYFSGSSHAAGKYHPEDIAPGYWDSIIGKNKAIDTGKYFVISMDTLVNISAYDKQVVTTGPTSINPATNKAYAMSFPIITVQDFVKTQKSLIDRLGIKKLHSIAGASGGAIQAMQWAADFPHMTNKIIAIIGPGLYLPAYSIAELDTWAQPILLDPLWQNGNYEHSAQPLSGLALALRNVTLSAVSFEWMNAQYGRRYALSGQNPSHAFSHEYLANSELLARGLERSKVVDANHFLYTVRAYQSFDVSTKVDNLKADFLFIPAKTDRIFPPELSYATATLLKSKGLTANVVEIDGGMGHLDGILKIALASDAIREFIEMKH